jgi:5'-nucleotidase
MAVHLLALVASASLSALPVEAGDMNPGVRKVVILHTNDLHGHLTAWTGWEGDLKGKTVGGLDRLARAVAQARREHGGAVLLLDAGDLIGDTMIADLTEGKALVEALNHLHYDALAVGNHEPDFDMDRLRQRAGDAKFPLLAANLVGKGDGVPFAKPYVVKRVNGVGVGVQGMA